MTAVAEGVALPDMLQRPRYDLLPAELRRFAEQFAINPVEYSAIPPELLQATLASKKILVGEAIAEHFRNPVFDSADHRANYRECVGRAIVSPLYQEVEEQVDAIYEELVDKNQEQVVNAEIRRLDKYIKTQGERLVPTKIMLYAEASRKGNKSKIDNIKPFFGAMGLKVAEPTHTIMNTSKAGISLEAMAPAASVERDAEATNRLRQLLATAAVASVVVVATTLPAAADEGYKSNGHQGNSNTSTQQTYIPSASQNNETGRSAAAPTVESATPTTIPSVTPSGSASTSETTTTAPNPDVAAANNGSTTTTETTPNVYGFIRNGDSATLATPRTSNPGDVVKVQPKYTYSPRERRTVPRDGGRTPDTQANHSDTPPVIISDPFNPNPNQSTNADPGVTPDATVTPHIDVASSEQRGTQEIQAFVPNVRKSLDRMHTALTTNNLNALSEGTNDLYTTIDPNHPGHVLKMHLSAADRTELAALHTAMLLVVDPQNANNLILDQAISEDSKATPLNSVMSQALEAGMQLKFSDTQDLNEMQKASLLLISKKMSDITTKSAEAQIDAAKVIYNNAHAPKASPETHGSYAERLLTARKQVIIDQINKSRASRNYVGHYTAEVITDAIFKYTEGTNISPEIIAAQLQQESGFREGVTSKGVGAMGMAQFMPKTWTYIATQIGHPGASPFDAIIAVQAQVYYMNGLYQEAEVGIRKGELQNDPLDTALAAYNWGMNSVKDYESQDGHHLPTVADIGQAYIRFGQTAHVPQQTVDYMSQITDRANRFTALAKSRVATAPHAPVPQPAPSPNNASHSHESQSQRAINIAMIRNHVVYTALSRVGDHESPIGCDHANTSAPGTCGPAVDTYTQRHLENWCADFASWVDEEAGAPQTGDYNNWRVPAVRTERDIFIAKGGYHPRGTYTPQLGDAVIFSSVHHTGIVTHVDLKNNVVYVTEGNTTTPESNDAHSVYTWHYSLDSSSIGGYGDLSVLVP